MSNLKLATTNYVDSHQSGGLKGEYVYIEEPYYNDRSIFKVGPEACGIEIDSGKGLTKELVINAGIAGANVTTAQVKLASYDGAATLKVCDYMGAIQSSLDISYDIPFSINHGQHEIFTVDNYNGVNLKSPSKLSIYPSVVSSPSVGIEIGAGSNSVYINGPIKFRNSIIDKDGNEITGGGGGGTPYVWDQEESTVGPGRVLYLGKDKDGGYASVFVNGPLYIANNFNGKITSIQTKDISNGTGIEIFDRNDEFSGRPTGLKLTAGAHDSVFTQGPQICTYNYDAICLSGGRGVTMMLHGDYVCFIEGDKYVDFNIDNLIALKALLNK